MDAADRAGPLALIGSPRKVASGLMPANQVAVSVPFALRSPEIASIAAWDFFWAFSFLPVATLAWSIAFLIRAARMSAESAGAVDAA